MDNTVKLEDKVLALQNELLAGPLVDGSVRHIFMPGIYMRELTIPKDTAMVGHYHKYNHISMLTKGCISILNDDGSLTKLVAPMTMISKPGKKCAFSHEDSIWVNVHYTNCTDVEEIEHELYDMSDAPQRIKELPLEIKQIVNKDYADVLLENELTEDEVQKENCIDNVIDALYGIYKCKLSDSKIHGKGIFATGNISDGEIIAPTMLGDKRTYIGRYLNHSNTPNSKVVLAPDGDTYLVATRYIQGCIGGNDGEEITTNYRDTLRLLGRSKCQLG